MQNSFTVITLVDITKTNEFRSTDKRRNQQRNYDTLVQTISLYTQPIELTVPQIQDASNIINKFGSKHVFTKEMINSKQIAWNWQFKVEQLEVFGPKNILLSNSLHNTPAISGLDETCVIDPSVFSLEGNDKNTIIIAKH
jgi:hypothetical protein